MSGKNYLAELYGLEKITAKNLNISEKFVYEINNKEGNPVKYKDPDRESEPLYKEWEKFLRKQLPKGKFSLGKHNGCFEIEAEIDNKIFVLSSEYIGPSKEWAARTFSDNEIRKEKMANILNVCRRFGGHMIWPKDQYIFLNQKDHESRMRITYGKNSQNNINMSRGGNKGVYDRFDITLYSLKKYYDLFINKDKKEYLNKGLYDRAEAFIASCNDKIDIKENGFRLFNLFLSFELTSEWFAIFDNFSKYIEVFKLEEFTETENKEPVIWGCDKENKIIKLWDKDENYKNYIDECINAIKKRTDQIEELIENW